MGVSASNPAPMIVSALVVSKRTNVLLLLLAAGAVLASPCPTSCYRLKCSWPWLILGSVCPLGVLHNTCDARESSSRQQLPTTAFCVGGPCPSEVVMLLVGCLPLDTSSVSELPGNNYLPSTIAFCVGGPCPSYDVGVCVGCLPMDVSSVSALPGNNYLLSTIAFCVGGPRPS